MFCEKCGAQLDDNAQFCTACGVQITKKEEAKTTEQFENVTGSAEVVNEIPNAGNANTNHAGNTGNAGGYGQQNYQQTPPPYQNGGAYTPKSRMAAGLLGIFLGSLGIHNFYLGNTNRALIQLLVCIIGGAITCGLASAAMWIWGLVEGIQILSGTITTDAQGHPLVD